MNSLFEQYDSHYSRVANTEPNWQAAERDPRKHACTKPWLPHDCNARILDFGCGWGNQLCVLWAAGYRNIEGVELVESQAGIAKRCAGERVAITCMDGREFLAEKSNAYDLIILNDVFEHIPTDGAVDLLACLKAALVPGGRLVLRVPNMANLFASYSRYLDLTHVTGYTEYSLMQILDQAGFCNHELVLPDWRPDWAHWRPWKPWRGLKLRRRLDYCLHSFLYWLRGYTKPRCFEHNVEVYTHKPEAS